jgi:Fe(3+) dicitrate transport protein
MVMRIKINKMFNKFHFLSQNTKFSFVFSSLVFFLMASPIFSDTLSLVSGEKLENVKTKTLEDSIEVQFSDTTKLIFPKSNIKNLEPSPLSWQTQDLQKLEPQPKNPAKSETEEAKEPDKNTERSKELGIIVKGEKEKDIGRLSDIHGTNIFAGKKNEVILPDKANANLAVNLNRQLYAKVPGIMVQENDGSGIQTSIAVRGLNPNRSWEFNTRQNGYDISADPMGYPEAYYTPPTEAVEKIEIVRGAGALQYGPQFGGLINYVLKKPKQDAKVSLETRNTVGSYGLFNSYNGVSGTSGKISYFSFFHHRNAEGWRQNAFYRTQTGHVHLSYNFTENLKLGVEFTRNDFKSQQPGGLLDGQAEYDPVLTKPGMVVSPRQSNRARNWLGIVWNIPAITLDYSLSENTKISWKTFGLYGERPSVGNISPIDRPDSIDSRTLTNSPRQFDEDIYKTIGTEARFISSYTLFGIKNTTSIGVRYFYGNTSRSRNISGSVGANFDKTQTNRINDFVVKNGDLRFSNINHAIYLEHMFQITNAFSVTPGFRYESIVSEASGYSNINTNAGANPNYRPANPKSLQNRVLLGGVGLQYKLFEKTNLYANYSQAFRPVLFSDLYTIGTTVNDIDPNLKNQFGYNADGGYRGKIKNYLNFDVGVFQLRYNNRVDTINGANRADYDALAIRSLGGTPNNLRTNVGDSLHRGVEAFLEFDPIQFFMKKSVYGNLSFFVSYAQIKATYIRWTAPTNAGLPDWDRIGNRVENAPDKIIRYGVTYFYKNIFSLTYQVSKVASIYTDATNTEYPTANAQAGKIAGYSVSDASFTYNLFDNFGIRGGINNLENRVYFTRRAGGLPGPGLIPAEGRTMYLGMVAAF